MVQAVHGLRPGDLPALYAVQRTGDPEERRKKDDAGHLREHVQLQEPVEDHELDQEENKMKEQKKTVVQIIEEAVAEFCDHYCKYPYEAKSQEELDKICEKCQFERIV